MRRARILDQGHGRAGVDDDASTGWTPDERRLKSCDCSRCASSVRPPSSRANAGRIPTDHQPPCIETTPVRDEKDPPPRKYFYGQIAYRSTTGRSRAWTGVSLDVYESSRDHPLVGQLRDPARTTLPALCLDPDRMIWSPDPRRRRNTLSGSRICSASGVQPPIEVRRRHRHRLPAQPNPFPKSISTTWPSVPRINGSCPGRSSTAPSARPSARPDPSRERGQGQVKKSALALCPGAGSSGSAWPGHRCAYPDVVLMDEPCSASRAESPTRRVEEAHREAGTPITQYVISDPRHGPGGQGLGPDHFFTSKKVVDETRTGTLVEADRTEVIFTHPG